MKITKRQLRKIIKEALLKEDRAERLTLWIQASANGNGLEIFVNESDISYDLGKYYHNDLNFGTFLDDFEADHGYPMPDAATVEDVGGMGFGTLPVEEAFNTAMDIYSDL